MSYTWSRTTLGEDLGEQMTEKDKRAVARTGVPRRGERRRRGRRLRPAGLQLGPRVGRDLIPMPGGPVGPRFYPPRAFAPHRTSQAIPPMRRDESLEDYYTIEGLGFSLKPPKWLRKMQPGKVLKKLAVPLAIGAGALLIPGVAPAAAGLIRGAAGAAGSAARLIGGKLVAPAIKQASGLIRGAMTNEPRTQLGLPGILARAVQGAIPGPVSVPVIESVEPASVPIVTAETSSVPLPGRVDYGIVDTGYESMALPSGSGIETMQPAPEYAMDPEQGEKLGQFVLWGGLAALAIGVAAISSRARRRA